MRKAFRIWIEVEQFDADRPDEPLDDAPDIAPDFGPTFVIVAARNDDTSVSRAKDRALGVAEQLHEAAAGLSCR